MSCAFRRCVMAAPDLPAADEATRRLRALVRSALSRGIWLIIALQLLMGLALRLPVSEEGGMAVVRMLLLVLATGGMLYGTAGASAALAAGREPVSVRAALVAGSPVFGQFLWLILKASLLAVGVLQVVLTLMIAASDQDPNQAMTELPSHMLPLTALLGFVLVYWMPVVFQRRDFRLFATLAQALRLMRARLAAAGFLAVLTLAPPALAWALAGRGGAPVAFLLQAVASLLAWTAYVYCVEWLQDAAPREPAPIS